MGTLPYISISIEGVRHSMMSHLMKHNEEIEQVINDRLATIDIKKIVEQTIDQNIGPILRLATEQCIKSAVSGALSDWTLEASLRDHITQAVIKALTTQATNA